MEVHCCLYFIPYEVFTLLHFCRLMPFLFVQLLLKKLYVRRMAADLGISRIYPSGKMIIMKTNMNKKVFRLMAEAMASETHRNSLSLTGKEIKVNVNISPFSFLEYVTKSPEKIHVKSIGVPRTMVCSPTWHLHAQILKVKDSSQQKPSIKPLSTSQKERR